MTDTRLTPAGPDIRRRIRLEQLGTTQSDAFAQLYALYKICFPLEDEREPPEAFARIFGLNHDLAVQQRFGPYREVVLLIRAWDGGPVIGGHIFGITTSPAHLAAGYPSSLQGIYTFIHPDFRGLSLVTLLIGHSKQMALDMFPPPPGITQPPILFFEVNNPARMTPEEIAQDTQSAGISPQERYRFWLAKGFRPLDFEYVQPRLRPEAAPVRYLDLFCSGTAGATIPSALAISHLRAFISVSVLKAQAAEEDQDYATMIAALPPRGIAVLTPGSITKV